MLGRKLFYKLICILLSWLNYIAIFMLLCFFFLMLFHIFINHLSKHNSIKNITIDMQQLLLCAETNYNNSPCFILEIEHSPKKLINEYTMAYLVVIASWWHTVMASWWFTLILKRLRGLARPSGVNVINVSSNLLHSLIYFYFRTKGLL